MIRSVIDEVAGLKAVPTKQTTIHIPGFKPVAIIALKQKFGPSEKWSFSQILSHMVSFVVEVHIYVRQSIYFLTKPPNPVKSFAMYFYGQI